MNLLEFLDRRHERKTRLLELRPPRPFDGKLLLGALFFLGYYALVYRFTFRDLPGANIPLLRDAMLVLGPPVGVIVGAIWRSDRRDEEQTRNTGEAFRAQRAQAEATTAAVAAAITSPTGAGGLNDADRPAGTPEDPVHVAEEPKL